MADSYAPYFLMDSHHRGASTVIASYSLIVYTLCAGVVRLWVGRKSETKFSFDDAGMISAIVFSIAAYVLYEKAVPPGLGSHQAGESSQNVIRTFQLVYAAQLLSIAAIWAAKLSTVGLGWRIESNSGRRSSWGFKVSLAIAGTWGSICLLLLAFQCPQPAWEYMGSTVFACSNGGTIQYAVIGLNMVTDVWLALVPLPVIWALQIPNDKKCRIMLLLSSRLIVPGFAIGQIIAVSHTQRSADKTWERAAQSVWEMLVTFFSVICAIVPRSQNFWGGLQSGGMRITNGNEYELSSGCRYKLSPGQFEEDSDRKSKQRFSKNVLVRRATAARPQRASEDSQRQLFSAFQAGYGKIETKVQAPSDSIRAAQDRGGSDQGNDNVIVQTVEFTVQRD